MYGWTGTVLRVNLTTRHLTKEPLREDWARDFIGGRGLGARYLLAEVGPPVDPLSPENKLIFVTGPLTGTNASCGSRYMVVTKGPLTNAITTSRFEPDAAAVSQICLGRRPAGRRTFCRAHR